MLLGGIPVKKRYLIVLAVVALVAIPAVVYAGHLGVSTGTAHLHPANGSGVQGVINFTDDGAGTLTVTGTATGLSGGEVSLIYDNGSVPGGPGTFNTPANKPPPGPDGLKAKNPSFLGNCEPVIFAGPGSLTFDQMVIGAWVPVGGGNWTLGPVVKTVTYAPLGDFDTVSIRNFAPGADQVKACGQVADHP